MRPQNQWCSNNTMRVIMVGRFFWRQLGIKRVCHIYCHISGHIKKETHKAASSAGTQNVQKMLDKRVDSKFPPKKMEKTTHISAKLGHAILERTCVGTRNTKDAVFLPHSRLAKFKRNTYHFFILYLISSEKKGEVDSLSL